MRYIKAFSILQLVVVIAIVTVLAAIVIPVVSMARGTASQVACLGNLRQVGMAMGAYADEHRGLLPAEKNYGDDDPDTSPAWFYRLPEYLERDDVRGNRTVFQCAAFKWSGGAVFDNASPKSFKFNSQIDNAGRDRFYQTGIHSDDSQIVAFFDAKAGETGAGQWGHGGPNQVDASRHNGRVNVLHLDGHTLSTAGGGADTDWEQELNWVSADW